MRTQVRKIERTEVHTTNESYRRRSTGHDINFVGYRKKAKKPGFFGLGREAEKPGFFTS